MFSNNLNGALTWSGRLGKSRKTGKPAWCRPGSRRGTLPFECGSPRLPHKHSRGDPPPVPPLTETVRATADSKAQPRTQPKTTQPKTAQPKTAQPKTAQPKTQPRTQPRMQQETQPRADA